MLSGSVKGSSPGGSFQLSVEAVKWQNSSAIATPVVFPQEARGVKLGY